jgi:hypothetical protein
VVLAEWAANGMKTDRADLVRRLRGMVDRAFTASNPESSLRNPLSPTGGEG